MDGKIIEIRENVVILEFNNHPNLEINTYLAFQDKRITVGEVINFNDNLVYVNLLGEIINDNFSYGITLKPTPKAKIILLNEEQVKHVLSYDNIPGQSLLLGTSPFYPNIKIHVDVNKLFNSHFAILGGTGSGKSFSVAKIIQNVFQMANKVPYKASLLVFDTFGEYHNVFKAIEKINPYIKVKNYTTNLESQDEILKIPPFLLDVDDLAILLNATTTEQLKIIERALYLVNIFKREDENIIKVKNDIIARAILDILLSGRPSVQIRDQIFSILAFYKTNELNLETTVSQPGYNRALKHCLIIDTEGKLQEMELLTNFFSNFLLETKEDVNKNNNICYSLADLENAVDFALISEGLFKSEKVYENNNLLKVRLHNLVTSENKIYFDYPAFITKESYINSLLVNGSTKYQIINFDINYIDDRFAKTIVKIISKMVFDVLKKYKPRAGYPIHLILEEAHRYVQNDNDVNLLGYNIFERISKEGRKYGILLGLISQRPSELSSTCISQCNNFLVFKITHPFDLDYIKNLIPYMTQDINKRLQIMKPGYCYTFGSAFKLPTMVKIDLPSPTPESNNVDISNTWYVDIRS